MGGAGRRGACCTCAQMSAPQERVTGGRGGGVAVAAAVAPSVTGAAAAAHTPNVFLVLFNTPNRTHALGHMPAQFRPCPPVHCRHRAVYLGDLERIRSFMWRMAAGGCGVAALRCGGVDGAVWRCMCKPRAAGRVSIALRHPPLLLSFLTSSSLSPFLSHLSPFPSSPLSPLPSPRSPPLLSSLPSSPLSPSLSSPPSSDLSHCSQ